MGCGNGRPGPAERNLRLQLAQACAGRAGLFQPVELAEVRRDQAPGTGVIGAGSGGFTPFRRRDFVVSRHEMDNVADQACTGRAMFFTGCVPPLRNSASSLPRTWRITSSEAQIPPGVERAYSRVAMFPPSPKMSSRSTTISPRLMPLRSYIRRSSPTSALGGPSLVARRGNIAPPPPRSGTRPECRGPPCRRCARRRPRSAVARVRRDEPSWRPASPPRPPRAAGCSRPHRRR